MDIKKIALDIVNNSKIAMFGSVDKSGKPQIKAMLCTEHDGLKTFWFCSNTSSKRGQDILKNPNTCLYFYEGFNGLMLSGVAEISYDDNFRQKFWVDEMYYHYKKGYTDPDFMLIKFTATSGNYYSEKNNQDFLIE